MVASSIVFSEPAVADVLMLVVIFAVPAARRHDASGACAHRSLIALARASSASGSRPLACRRTSTRRITHQLVTLFLAAERLRACGLHRGRSRAALPPRHDVATSSAAWSRRLAAFVGYFELLPSAYDLFTNFGRARGTFKDPERLRRRDGAGHRLCRLEHAARAPRRGDAGRRRWRSSSASALLISVLARRLDLDGAVVALLAAGSRSCARAAAPISSASRIVAVLGSLGIVVAHRRRPADRRRRARSDRAREPRSVLRQRPRRPLRRPGQGRRSDPRAPVRHRHALVPRHLPSRGSAQRLPQHVPQRRLARRPALHRCPSRRRLSSASVASCRATARCRAPSSSRPRHSRASSSRASSSIPTTGVTSSF